LRETWCAIAMAIKHKRTSNTILFIGIEFLDVVVLLFVEMLYLDVVFVFKQKAVSFHIYDNGQTRALMEIPDYLVLLSFYLLWSETKALALFRRYLEH
jgi:hypothetical protein